MRLPLRTANSQQPTARNRERIAVIGLGRFGSSAARVLHEIGYEVTAIDVSETRVAEAVHYSTMAVQGDGTNEELLRSLQVDRSHVAIVGQGENLEASMLITLVLKRIGVPWVIAKATSELHAELLQRIGADRVVYPEIDAGAAVAHSVILRNIDDYLELTHTVGAAKVTTPQHLVGQSIHDLAAACGGRVHVTVIVRGGKHLLVCPGLDERIEQDDVLLLVGPDRDLSALVNDTVTAQSHAQGRA